MARVYRTPGYKNFNRETTRPINFVFGILLLIVSIFFMFTRETLLRPSYQLDAFFLIGAAVLSLWAAMSDKKRTIFLINISLGVLFILSALMITAFRYYDIEWMIAVLFDYTGGDAFAHLIIGLVFFFNALNSRQQNYQDRTTSTLEDSIRQIF